MNPALLWGGSLTGWVDDPNRRAHNYLQLRLALPHGSSARTPLTGRLTQAVQRLVRAPQWRKTQPSRVTA